VKLEMREPRLGVVCERDSVEELLSELALLLIQYGYSHEFLQQPLSSSGIPIRITDPSGHVEIARIYRDIYAIDVGAAGEAEG